jgi:hypothetical protein
MNARTAAPVIAIASLVVLMSGCAGVAAQGGQVRDDLRPAANAAAELGLAEGSVIVRDDLSPTQVHNRITERMAELAAQEPRGFSADVLRELHAQGAAPQSARSVSADARRELHSQAVPVEQSAFSADAMRELHSQPVSVEQSAFSADVMRELKGSTEVQPSAAVDVRDDLSPSRGDDSAPSTDTVDDDLSPIGGSF